MAVIVPSPKRSRTVVARYVPSPRSQGEASLYGFTPWVVAPGSIIAPTILNGFEMEVPAGPLTFRFEGPSDLHIQDDGSVVVFQSQPRPPYPT
jgi:hypothetical protein